MSSLEGNKIAAAILVGGMITLSVGIITDFIYRPHHGAEAAQAGGEGAPAVKQKAPVEPVLGLIATADVAAGQAVAKKCESCHDFSAAHAKKPGPGLYGVIGRQAGTLEGFTYSEAMKAHGKPWTYADLNRFVTHPKDVVPGTKMSFPGLPKKEDRAALLAWLRNQAASPAPLPTPEEIAAEEAAFKAEQDAVTAGAAAAAPAAQPAAQPAVEPTAEQPAGEQTAAAAPAADVNAVSLIATADPEAGKKVANKCKSCHDFSEANAKKPGPGLWGVLGRNHAALPDFAYSDAMKALAGKPWTFEDMDAFIANPKEHIPGTKMSFPGLKKPEERAALLRWLRDQSSSPVPLPQ